MVSVGVLPLERIGLQFFMSLMLGMEMNGQYRLMQKRLPDINVFLEITSVSNTTQRRRTVDLLKRLTPDFIPPSHYTK